MRLVVYQNIAMTVECVHVWQEVCLLGDHGTPCLFILTDDHFAEVIELA